MPPQSRLGDDSKCPIDVHGCPACPHTTDGPAISGSPDVMVNKRPALRVTDHGVHETGFCCTVNMWTAVKGSATVFINNLPAHRKGDMDMHCGGVGTMQKGSDNVETGD
jgi:uncharacterized Zn-binding protein involved in type VI secretion